MAYLGEYKMESVLYNQGDKWVGHIKLARRLQFKAEGATYFQCVINLEAAFEKWLRSSEERLRLKSNQIRKQLESMKKEGKHAAPKEDHYGW